MLHTHQNKLEKVTCDILLTDCKFFDVTHFLKFIFKLSFNGKYEVEMLRDPSSRNLTKSTAFLLTSFSLVLMRNSGFVKNQELLDKYHEQLSYPENDYLVNFVHIVSVSLGRTLLL